MLGDGHDGLHVAGRARHVHGHDEFGARRDLPLQVLRVHAETVVHFTQDRDGVGVDDRADGGDPEERGHDDFASRPHPEGGHRREQSAGPAIDPQGMLDAVEFPGSLFQSRGVTWLVDSVIAEQSAPVQHIQNRLILSFVQPVGPGKRVRPFHFLNLHKSSRRAAPNSAQPASRQHTPRREEAVARSDCVGRSLAGFQGRVNEFGEARRPNKTPVTPGPAILHSSFYLLHSPNSPPGVPP